MEISFLVEDMNNKIKKYRIIYKNLAYKLRELNKRINVHARNNQIHNVKIANAVKIVAVNLKYNK